MKIPAHLLSPVASNSKGAPNMPPQSVADFLKEQSEAPKDFLSAMKALQKLSKPQRASEHAISAEKGAAEHGSKSTRTTLAELKFADSKLENTEQQDLDSDVFQELTPSTEVEEAQLAKSMSTDKPVSADRIALSQVNQSEPVLLKNKVDAADLQQRLEDGANVASDNSSKQNRLAETGKLANAIPSTDGATQSATTVAENIRIIERAFTGVDQKGRNQRPTTASEASTTSWSRLATPADENARRMDISQLATDTTSLKSSNLAAKSAANSETPYGQNFQRVETALESKPSIDTIAQTQGKVATAPQLASANMPTTQAMPLATAKDISAQVTRHLNSELLNMDLRTQVVAERTSTGALNTSTLTLQLHPIGLGRVQAEIRKDGDLVRIKLTVEASGTFEVLKNDIDALKAAMRALGTSEGDVTLTQGNINRLPNDAANESQNYFSNDRDGQSELNGRQDQDTNGHTNPHSGAEEAADLNRAAEQTQQDGINTVFI
ncbi:MAG: flagellar hook-length control protein FliK [Pseudomonadota bacterium]